ncbi:hypothetical protein V5O48_013345 [Marasmius crinis-equi]|uniref:F-box domain-containing protein n=1 Tax=Marasmius crinis-equi TaxID=585013 RepID=A0ABR3F0C7_9AGAR
MNTACPRCGFESDSILLSDIKAPPEAIIALSKTNDPPSPAAAQLCRTNISNVDTQILKLDEAIAQHHEALRLLQQERLRLLTLSQPYRQVVHPARRLPLEVLGEIFLACMDKPRIIREHITYREPCDYDSLDGRKPWWCLAQVSRHWRTVAMSRPRIWSYVAVDFPDLKSFDPEQFTARLIVQLQRSRSEPLTVAMRSAHKGSRDSHLPVITALCAHSSRWESLRVDFGYNALPMLRSMSRLVQGNVPALSRLHIDLSKSTLSASSSALDAFSVAPQLVHVTLLGPITPATDDLLRLPWSQITRYRCDTLKTHLDTSHNSEILARMHSLTALQCHLYFAGEPNGPANIHMPSLELLSLYPFKETASNLSPLLDRLSVPALLDLRIVACPDIDSLPRFIQRSGTTLRSLSLYVNGLDIATINQVFEHIPKLHSLSLRGASYEVIRSLSENDSESRTPQLLPKLHAIRLCGPWTSDRVQEALLVEMVETRVPALDSTPSSASHLRVIDLDPEIDFGEDTIEALNGYRSRGLQVHRSPVNQFFQIDP